MGRRVREVRGGRLAATATPRRDRIRPTLGTWQRDGVVADASGTEAVLVDRAAAVAVAARRLVDRLGFVELAHGTMIDLAKIE